MEDIVAGTCWWKCRVEPKYIWIRGSCFVKEHRLSEIFSPSMTATKSYGGRLYIGPVVHTKPVYLAIISADDTI